MNKWEYQVIELKTQHENRLLALEENTTAFVKFKKISGIFGEKIKILPMTIDEIEDRFDELGRDGWELCETISLTAQATGYGGSYTDKVYFIFKKPII